MLQLCYDVKRIYLIDYIWPSAHIETIWGYYAQVNTFISEYLFWRKINESFRFENQI